MKIPKIAHRIWFGEPIPDKYKDYLRLLVELNPDYAINLWSDPITMSESYYQELQQFCAQNKITLRNLRTHQDLENYPLIIEELDAALKNKTHRRLHYVRASDIARISILYKEGGVYTDTDSKMKTAFPEFEGKHGILLKLDTNAQSNSLYELYPSNISTQPDKYFFKYMPYDFMASCPNHTLLKTTAQITALDYKTYHASHHREWETSTNAALLMCGTIQLTGSSLKWALNHLHQQGNIALVDPNQLFIFTNPFMDADYDKSWLEGFKDNDEDDDDSELKQNIFLGEIYSNRKAHFPFSLEHEPTSSSHIHQSHDPLSVETDRHVVDLQFIAHATASSFKHPKFDLPDQHVFTLKIADDVPRAAPSMPTFTLPTKKCLRDTYQKNGGGLLATFSIFHAENSRTVDDIVNILKRRAENAGPDSASRKTLTELKLA